MTTIPTLRQWPIAYKEKAAGGPAATMKMRTLPHVEAQALVSVNC